MYIRKFLIAMITILAANTYGQPDKFAVANGMADRMEHHNALEVYRQIEFSGKISAELYFNMANSYVALDSLALGILYYERALKINPSHRAAEHNLQIVHHLLDYDIIAIPDFVLITFWRNFYQTFSPNRWAWISLMFFGALSIFIYYILFREGRNLRIRIKALVILLILTGFLAALSAGLMRRSHFISSREGIVLRTAMLKSGPDHRSDDIKLLKPGYKLFIQDQLQGWFKVRTEDRETGWVDPDVFDEI
ncbi:MAG TPA: hypothetical protein PKC30_16670 [Saprospiraceae bacterium]|nr:hypothetical protein [Saprospiraceae bacterium]